MIILRMITCFMLLMAFIITDGVKAEEVFKKEKEALVIIADFSDKLCASAPVKGKASEVSLSASITADLATFLKKLVGLGAEAAAKYETSTYSGVLQKDLANALTDTNQCKLKVWSDLNEKLLPNSEPGCRHPDNGIEYWGHTEKWSADSGWRKGGSSANQYCGEQKILRERATPNRKVVLLSTNDDHKVVRDPFKRDFYRYTCSFEDRWQPIYKFKDNMACLK